MYHIKIFSTPTNVDRMGKEIEEWLRSLKSEYEIVFMTQSESEETIFITFLYR